MLNQSTGFSKKAVVRLILGLEGFFKHLRARSRDQLGGALHEPTVIERPRLRICDALA